MAITCGNKTEEKRQKRVQTVTSMGEVTLTLPPKPFTLNFLAVKGVPQSLTLLTLEVVDNFEDCIESKRSTRIAIIAILLSVKSSSRLAGKTANFA